MQKVLEFKAMKIYQLTTSLLLMAAIHTGSISADENQNVDPLEDLNRKTYAFNSVLDDYILRPIAKGYKAIAPDPLERGILNIFSNLGEISNVVNNTLQGKIGAAGHSSARLLINTTVGVGGLFDVARRAGLRERDGEDFGQTLAAWGVKEGPFLMLPLIGPSSLRDAPSMFIDTLADPTSSLDDVPTRNSLVGMDLLTVRADLLALDEVMSGDKYLFMRDVYIQRREYLVADGLIEDDLDYLDDY
jgi:phospholipid-binding lipoprotein MlaA